MGRRRDSRTGSIAIIKAKLEDLEPVEGRKPYVVVAVEVGQSLSHLAATILLSFGFEIDHCYGFYSDTRHYTRSTEKYELFADIGEAEGPGVQNISIEQVFEPGRKMLFLFDYGDQWHFIVRLERFEDVTPGQEYPAVMRSHAIPLDDYYEDEWSDDDEEDDDEDPPFFDDTDEDWRNELSSAPGVINRDVVAAQESPTSSLAGEPPFEPPFEPPTVEQWGDLFDAAVAFRDSRCFDWVDDTRLFGISDPASGKVWYCLILGNAGTVYGMVAYEGPTGLAALLEAMEPDSHPENAMGPNSPRSLLMFLSSRNMLDPEDLRIIKRLGLKFRGANQWPQFRSVLPGYRPWYLTGDEAVTMALLLRQSLVVADKLRDDPDFPLVMEDWAILTRVPEGEETGSFADEYIKPNAETVAPGYFDVAIDDLKVRRLRRDLVRSKSIWEISVKWVQEPIRETPDSRPFYPIMLVWVDRSTGIVLSARLTSLHKLPDELVNSTLACMEQHAIIPKEIEVDSADAMVILDKLSKRIGVELRQVDNLRKSDIIREELYEYLKRNK